MKLFLSFIFFLTVTQVEADVLQVSTGSSHSCALYDDETVDCWREYDAEVVHTPKLYGPRAITSGPHFACAIDRTGVQCWGEEISDDILKPKLFHPTAIAAGSNHVCVIDEQKVKCWGSNYKGQSDAPKNFTNPTAISAGYQHTCALFTEGVKCWGENYSGQLNVPYLKNPKAITSGNGYNCAIDDTGIKCWSRFIDQMGEIPKFKNPISIASGSSHVCAMDEDLSIKCWGSKNLHKELNAPSIRQPIGLVSGSSSDHACIIDKDSYYGFTCWGNNNSGQVKTNFMIKQEKEGLEAERKAKVDAIAKKEEAARKKQEVEKAAAESLRRSKSVDMIPVGSSFLFSKEILIPKGKSSLKVSDENTSLQSCSLLESNTSIERRIKINKEYFISEVLVDDSSEEVSTTFTLDNTSLSIYCLSSYSVPLRIGELSDSLDKYGIKLKTLKIPEPLDL